MRFGMNLLMWTDTLTDEMLPLLEELKQIGFDTVEIPCFDLDNLDDYAKWGKRFDELGLWRTSTACREDDTCWCLSGLQWSHSTSQRQTLDFGQGVL